jgi:hypothetical protein
MTGHNLPMCYSYSKFLLYSSCTIGISAVIAYIMNDLYVTVYLLLLFLTSINYWRKPEYGLRRNIDLTAVSIGGVYALLNIFLLKDEFHRVGLLIILFCTIVFFILEHILSYFDSPKWIVIHMALHIYFVCGTLLVIFD